MAVRSDGYARHVVYIAFFIAVVLAFFSFWASFSQSAEMEQVRVEKQLEELSQLEKTYIVSIVDTMLAQAEDLARLVAAYSNPIGAEAQAVLDLYADDQRLLVVLLGGQYYTTYPTYQSMFTGVGGAFLPSEECKVSRVFWGKDGVPLFAISAPIYRGDVFLGSLFIIYSTDEFSSIMDTQIFEDEGYAHIFQSDGSYVARSIHSGSTVEVESIFWIKEATFHEGFSYERFYEDVQAGRSGYTSYTSTAGAPRYAYYCPVGINDWYVILVAPTALMDKYAQESNRSTTMLVLKLALILVFIIVVVGYDQRNQLRRIRATESELKLSSERFAFALIHLPSVVFDYDYKSDSIRILNNPLSEVFGAAGDLIEGISTLTGHLHPEDTEKYTELYQSLHECSDTCSEVLRIETPDTPNDYTWYRLTLTPIKESKGKTRSAVGMIEDVDYQVRTEQRLRHRAERDPLTGLFNRAECERRIGQLLANREVSGVFAIMDLDDFKMINDTRGHQFGDFTLVALAQAMRSVFRQSDIYGRLAGDEFMVFIFGNVSEQMVRKRFDQLRRAYVTALNDPDLSLSFSVGISCVRAGDRFSDLYRRADSALYRAKELGKGRLMMEDEGQNSVK